MTTRRRVGEEGARVAGQVLERRRATWRRCAPEHLSRMRSRNSESTRFIFVRRLGWPRRKRAGLGSRSSRSTRPTRLPGTISRQRDAREGMGPAGTGPHRREPAAMACGARDRESGRRHQAMIGSHAVHSRRLPRSSGGRYWATGRRRRQRLRNTDGSPHWAIRDVSGRFVRAVGDRRSSASSDRHIRPLFVPIVPRDYRTVQTMAEATIKRGEASRPRNPQQEMIKNRGLGGDVFGPGRRFVQPEGLRGGRQGDQAGGRHPAAVPKRTLQDQRDASDVMILAAVIAGATAAIRRSAADHRPGR